MTKPDPQVRSAVRTQPTPELEGHEPLHER